MSHHCSEQPATVRDLVAALCQLDQNLPVFETWNEVPGWFDVDDGRVWLGTQKCSDDLGHCRNQ